MGYTPPYLEVRKITGAYNIYAPSSTSGDDVYLYPNLTDTTPRIALFGNNYIELKNTAGYGTRFLDAGTEALRITYETANSHVAIASKIDAKDLYLETTGTGVIKFGTYTAGAATDSTGYITIKDAAGNTRKLMVQA